MVMYQMTIDDYLNMVKLEQITDEELVKEIEDYFKVTTTMENGSHKFKKNKLTFAFYLDRLIGNGDWEEEEESPTGQRVIMWDVWGRTYGGGGPADSVEEVIRHFNHYLSKGVST
jgi:hypothetical protein